MLLIAVAIESFTFFGCHIADPGLKPQRVAEPTLDVLYDHLRKLAGQEAVDCVNGDRKTASDCVMKAHSAGQPFFVLYRLQGIDSLVAIGLATNARQEGFEVDFDSMGLETRNLPKGHVPSHNNHVITYPCPSPLKLRITEKGRVSCFPPSNIMAPNTGLY